MMLALTFTIHLKEPLLATALGGDPNSAVSLPFIPGSVVRGALIAQYLRCHNTKDLAVDPEARKLFFDAQTRYLNAYPIVGSAMYRTLPLPAAWKRDKGSTTPIYDLSVDPDDPDVEGWQPESLKAPFCHLNGKMVTLIEPQKQVQIHTQRDRVMGRATQDQGAVFRYEALAPEQYFGAVVLCPDMATYEVLSPLFQGKALLMGGSHNAGYGLVEIENVELKSAWSETPSSPTAIHAGESLILTLLSDALLRDENGHYTGLLTAEMLAEVLGISLREIPERTYAKTGIVGGFNRKWGLPLVQTAAACAGSVFAFEAEADIPTGAIVKLLARGIGERRSEGFGRLAVNWHAEHAVLRIPESEPYTSLVKAPRLSTESKHLARRMAERMLRRKLDGYVHEQVNILRFDGSIKNAQLSGIRTLVRTAISTGDLTPILGRLEQMRQTGREQFEKTRVNGKPLDAWITDVLKVDIEGMDRKLFKTSLDLPSVGGVSAVWDASLAQEYALHLVDGVLSRKLAERRKEAE